MFVVTIPTSAVGDPLAFAVKAKAAGADVLEVRGDLTPDIKPFTSPLPILLALRGANPALIQALKPAYLDIDTAEASIKDIPADCKVILSMHDFTSVPRASSALVDPLIAHRGWGVKCAAMANYFGDLYVLETIRARLQSFHKNVTVLGMGDKAHLSRALSPLRNTFTFTYVDGDAPVAPGQLPLSFYKSTSHVKNPTLFGILGGEQVLVSKSPLIQNALMHAHGFDGLYSVFPATDLSESLSSLKSMGVTGFSVTAPFKRKILAFANVLHVDVQELGTANTLVQGADETWTAYNTDLHGITAGYPFLKDVKSVAILGAGGVVPSVIRAVRMMNKVCDIKIFARDMVKAEKELGKGVTILPLDTIDVHTADAVICSISDDIDVDLPMQKGAHAIDLRYGKPTKFLITAKERGYVLHDGTSMLMHQALKQFELFTGIVPTAADISLVQSIL